MQRSAFLMLDYCGGRVMVPDSDAIIVVRQLGEEPDVCQALIQ